MTSAVNLSPGPVVYEPGGEEITWRGQTHQLGAVRPGRIWDLHVHTPASIVQGYGGDNEETWSRFLDELESLPDESTGRRSRSEQRSSLAAYLRSPDAFGA
ncbi:hypothetical protein GCM10010522_31680 [Kribbella solani]